MALFWTCAAAMLAAALAFVLWPLRSRGADATHTQRRAIEQARRSGVLSDAEAEAKLAAITADPAPTAPRALVATLFVLLPLSAILLYRQIGEPRALDTEWNRTAAAMAAAQSGRVATSDSSDAADSANAAAPDLSEAVTGLAARLAQEPDDLQGWMLLGRAYKTLERFDPAREALSNAYRLAPDDPDVLVEYAEAQVLASDTRRFEGEPLDLLRRALSLSPQHARGLWLLGISDYQVGRYAEAAATWERLLASLPPEADALESLRERIAEARSRAGMPLQTPPDDTTAAASSAPTPDDAGTSPTAAASGGDGPRLTVRVEISPELATRVGASDVLFVFARAAQGPRMPLAIQRLPAASLPVTVTLDDSTSMMPQLKLSTMPQVVVGARVSKSGQATPQSGDFEALSAPIANTQTETVQLRIESVVP